MKYVLPVLVCVLVMGGAVAHAATEPYVQSGHEYYVVNGADPDKDTGTKVCTAVGKTCVGYTGNDTKACKYFHADASETTGVNGSKAGFYCDGAPQSGVCATATNSCQVCPACNVNATCDTNIGDQYREMYVECSGGTATTVSVKPFDFSGWWTGLWSVPVKWMNGFATTWSAFWSRWGLAQIVQKATIQVQGPTGTESVDIPTDSYVCEFYQTNKKLVTCAAIGNADQFCVTAMSSRHARASLCQEDGLVVCNAPCTTSPQELMPKTCAFDNDRSRGKQAAPLNFCTTTTKIQVNTGVQATKKAGEVCNHGGECGTGICLGQPSDNGIKYFCSCKQNVHDYTCGK